MAVCSLDSVSLIPRASRAEAYTTQVVGEFAGLKPLRERLELLAAHGFVVFPEARRLDEHSVTRWDGTRIDANQFPTYPGPRSTWPGSSPVGSPLGDDRDAVHEGPRGCRSGSARAPRRWPRPGPCPDQRGPCRPSSRDAARRGPRARAGSRVRSSSCGSPLRASGVPPPGRISLRTRGYVPKERGCGFPIGVRIPAASALPSEPMWVKGWASAWTRFTSSFPKEIWNPSPSCSIRRSRSPSSGVVPRASPRSTIERPSTSSRNELTKVRPQRGPPGLGLPGARRAAVPVRPDR